MKAHPSCPRLPEISFDIPQPGELLPRLPAVARAEQSSVFNPGKNCFRICQGRGELPDSLELPGALGAVVELVCGRSAFVDEFVANWRPGAAAVIGALDHLPKPAAGLRSIEPIRIDWRSLDVIDLPTGEMRPADIPALPPEV